MFTEKFFVTKTTGRKPKERVDLRSWTYTSGYRGLKSATEKIRYLDSHAKASHAQLAEVVGCDKSLVTRALHREDKEDGTTGPGRSSYLHVDDQVELVATIKQRQLELCPMTYAEINEIAHQLKAKRSGANWVPEPHKQFAYLFTRNHPDLTPVTPQTLDADRHDATSATKIEGFFETVRSNVDPSRLFLFFLHFFFIFFIFFVQLRQKVDI